MADASVAIIGRNVAERRILRHTMSEQGYAVNEAFDAKDISGSDEPCNPIVILLDLDDPSHFGLATILKFKDRARTAVIAISSNGDVSNKVAALDLGADDYIIRPFDLDELSARLRAALRHAARKDGMTPVVTVGSLEIDRAAHEVRKGGMPVHLTRKEYDILLALASSPGRVLTHQQLLERVWPHSADLHIEYLRIAVRSLRQKIEPEPTHPTLILNELGVGYRLNIRR